jgi:broad specificity phosphatase PhoE
MLSQRETVSSILCPFCQFALRWIEIKQGLRLWLIYPQENRDIHQTIPDHRVKLTPEGWTQAYEAGRRLRSLLRADDTLHFFTSPYRRTRETTEGILSTLTSDEPSPSAFPRHSIKVYEEPRLREQDFGNFQPCSAEMERMWQERADYGHFFYRIPNGESAADAYDRVSGFNESLWRQFGENDFASVCVLGMFLSFSPLYSEPYLWGLSCGHWDL